MNAFVALGGQSNGEGRIDKKKISDMINDEFGLSIEEFLGDIEDNELDFRAFCLLFEAIEESRTHSRMSGVLTVSN